MRVLVTGGSGVVGEAAVQALVARGHEVRLMTRHADDAAKRWPKGVEPHAGDVTRAESVRGAADGCDAVLHVVGIVDESPPELTFEAVNVEGTRRIVAEAERAGVPHLVYVSSLGAERGASPYHRSKHEGEKIARQFRGRWVIVRPGNVYGPGDEVVSLLLRMVRTLPAVPVVGGDTEFQPVWAEDVGEALAEAVERDDLAGRVLDVAGVERTTVNDLLDRFARLTGREPTRVPVPNVLAGLGVRVAGALGIDVPVNDSQLTMLAEGNVIDPPATNALHDVLRVRPTPLDDGLRKLLDALPEQLAEDGVGALTRKRFRADIVGPTRSADEIFATLCAHFQEMSPDQMNLGAEPGAPTAVLERGQTVTMALPMRGNVQVRVAELGPTLMTLLTVEGHPLAGGLRFSLGPPPAAVDTGVLRFEVTVIDRAANVVDWMAMATVGGRLQNDTWKEMVERVVRESGGEAPNGVESEESKLDGEEAAEVEGWLRELSLSLAREAHDV